MVWTILILNGGFLAFILLYSLVQLDLVISYRRHRRKQRKERPEELSFDPAKAPWVTVQLPVYNEYYVVERAIDAVVRLEYPADRLEIQVLDDSTDETVDLIDRKVAEWQGRGVNIKGVRRNDREGFKAGALAHGLEQAQGSLLAVFDADFLPEPDFLQRTVPCFEDPEVGMVQTSWQHINEDHSWLTRLQAFGLNAHFSVEQVGRNNGGHFMNFNGTAGVWRKSCIREAGGWQSDTLTEDLDLSYRAQLNGWRFRYLEEVGAPAELPAAMNALKTQQYRWNKGAAECTRKNLPKVLKRSDLGLRSKLHAVFHLMNSAVFICVLGTALLSIPSLWIKHHHPELKLVFQAASGFVVALFLLVMFYWTSMSHQREKVGGKEFLMFLKRFPLFLSVSMGLSLHNGLAVLEGYFGRRTAFVRTPKFNITGAGDHWSGKRYKVGKATYLTAFEGLLTLYFLGGILLAFHFGDLGLLPLHLLLSLGFGYVFYYSLRHAR